MTPSASTFFLKSEFEDFLFTPIGEDKNGMLLSVLSAFARLNLDPWQEAAELDQLPGEPATQRLASLIAALPDRPMAHLDPLTVAARLIAHLPRRARSSIWSRETRLSIGEAMNFRVAAIYVSVIFVVLMSVAISSRLPQAQVDNPHSLSLGTASSWTPPTISGQ
jgi:hypothetical protein